MPIELPRHLVPIAAVLKRKYQDFAHYNLADPLDELIFIICSTRTNERGYRTAYENLRAAYPGSTTLAEASVDDIAWLLKEGGLAKKKAQQIHSALQYIRTDEFARDNWPTLIV